MSSLEISNLHYATPQFVKIQVGENDNLSHQMMILSMFISPFALAALSPVFFDSRYNINFIPLLKDLFVLCALPILVAPPLRSFLKRSPATFGRLLRSIPILNMFCIGLISYSLLGTTIVKVGFSSFQTADIVSVFVFTFCQDFGIYFLSLYIGSLIFGKSNDANFFVPLSMKNIALAGSVLLFYHPKASFAASCGFLAHSLFFIYLSTRKSVKVQS